MSEKSLYPPSPPGESKTYEIGRTVLGMESTLGVGEERSEVEKGAWRLLDWKLLPFTAAIFLLAGTAGSGSGTSAFSGSMQQQLNLTAAQYSYCSSLLFAPHITEEFLSSILVREFTARIFFSTFMIIWGLLLVLFGLVTSDQGVLTVRAFLGALLWPLAPPAISWLSMFFTRKDLSLRLALLFAASSLFDSVVGLLRGGIQGMSGIGGKPMWAWLLILGGFFTIGVGVAGFFLIGSTPKDCNFFTPEQKELVLARLERDRPSIVPCDVFSLREFFRAILSPHVLILAILFFMVGTIEFGLAMSFPSIIDALGATGIKAQLLGVGPFITGFFITIKSAAISDNNQSRGITTALLATVAVAGHIVFFATNNKYIAYGALYLMVAIFSTTPILFAWLSNNSEAFYRRATAIAFGFVAGNSGCVLSTWVFSPQDGPKHRKTATMNLIFCIGIVLFSILNVTYLSRKNKSKATLGRRDLVLQKYSEDNDGGLRAWMELGDEHPDFQYIL